MFVIIAQEDEEKDPDDLMEHERPAPKIDFSKMDPSNPESILQMSKKGKTLMMFVTVSEDPTKEEAETITQRWQDQLFNANYQIQRYLKLVTFQTDSLIQSIQTILHVFALFGGNIQIGICSCTWSRWYVMLVLKH